ncbi:30S ribosomal protein S27e [Candidatus Woesearchaeota archaeon]|nr:30S ribosomal protein S27e [Candidatus Woesearchaeota archaeon]
MRKVKDCKTSFVKVRCSKCKNEQNVFNSASTKVNCLVCGEVLAEPTGGKANFIAKVLEILP